MFIIVSFLAAPMELVLSVVASLGGHDWPLCLILCWLPPEMLGGAYRAYLTAHLSTCYSGSVHQFGSIAIINYYRLIGQNNRHIQSHTFVD